MDGPSQSLSPSQQKQKATFGRPFAFANRRRGANPVAFRATGSTHLPMDSIEMPSNIGCRQHIQFSWFLYVLAGVVLRPPSLQR